MKVVKDVNGNVVKFTINRKTWLRGNPNTSVMRNQHGSMCCLGHFARACGIPATTLVDKTTPGLMRIWGIKLPSQIEDALTERKVSHYSGETYIVNSDLASEFIEANDKKDTPQAKRERKIKELFLDYPTGPIEVEFTN